MLTNTFKPAEIESRVNPTLHSSVFDFDQGNRHKFSLNEEGRKGSSRKGKSGVNSQRSRLWKRNETHISVKVMAQSTANGWQPITGSRNEKHLIPGTEAGWICRQKILSDGQGMLSEKCQGEEKTGLQKYSVMQSDGWKLLFPMHFESQVRVIQSHREKRMASPLHCPCKGTRKQVRQQLRNTFKERCTIIL